MSPGSHIILGQSGQSLMSRHVTKFIILEFGQFYIKSFTPKKVKQGIVQEIWEKVKQGIVQEIWEFCF